MRNLKINVILCLVLAIPILSGCGKDAESSISNVGFQQEVEQNTSLMSVEQITIPTEEWTVDTLCQAMVINGKNITYPTMTMRDLGDGFGFYHPDSPNIMYNDLTHVAVSMISYQDELIGYVGVCDYDSEETFWDTNIKELSLSFENHDGSKTSLASLNGLTIGSTTELMHEKLNFMDIIESDETKGNYRLKKKIDDISIECTYVDGVLISFTIRYGE